MAGFTTSWRTTGVAGRKLALPAWEAVMLAVPAPTIVTVLPLTVATEALSLAKLTGSPEVADALRAKGASEASLAASGAKLIVCDCCTVPPEVTVIS